MARLARVVVAGVAHHVAQRGNRRQEPFFCEEDYRAYLAMAGCVAASVRAGCSESLRFWTGSNGRWGEWRTRPNPAPSRQKQRK